MPSSSLPQGNDLGSFPSVSRSEYRNHGEAGLSVQGPCDLLVAKLRAQSPAVRTDWGGLGSDPGLTTRTSPMRSRSMRRPERLGDRVRRDRRTIGGRAKPHLRPLLALLAMNAEVAGRRAPPATSCSPSHRSTPTAP
jgi:hypothetical protein